MNPELTQELQEAIGFPDEASRGMVVRLAMLMTHYRAPINWTAGRLREATGIYRKWLRVAKEDIEITEPPAEVMEALLDDMNTPLAIMAMTRLAKEKKAGELHASMKLLGFVP